MLLSAPAWAQVAKTPSKLVVISDVKAYNASYKTNKDLELVEINKAIPTIKLDIRYATTNNCMKQVMYKQARAFARRAAVEQLKKVQADLKKDGYGLKIFDGYRPYAVTVDFYKKIGDKRFVADPAEGSKHNRGCALDLTLINLKTGKELEMPTPYDSFEPKAASAYADLPAHVIKNRDYLIAVMHKHGFMVVKNEWWHFDFNGWKNYPLMDIPFDKL